MQSRFVLLGLVATSLTTIGITEGIVEAGFQKNGVQVNGVQVNGVQVNGVQVNGVQVNGVQVNGVQVNGVQVNGVQVNGTQLSGSFVGAKSSCSHSEGVQGAALPGSCSPCAQIVVNADAYCTNNYWDSLCVSRAVTSCKVTNAGWLNQQFKVSYPDGSWAQVKVNQVQQGPSSYYNGSQYVSMTDVWYHTISYTCPHAATVAGVKMPLGCSSTVDAVCASDSYCCNNSWDGICVNEANSWAAANKTVKAVSGPICGNVRDTNGDGVGDAPGRGVFVAGRWANTSGSGGAGGKVSWSTSDITFACENTGAIAKCVNQGFKPWVSSSMDSLHQACVRMVRADFCGDGVSWTVDGTSINVRDWSGMQTDAAAWVGEAGWGVNGARYVNQDRISGASSATTSSTLGAYKASHSYCSYTTVFGVTDGRYEDCEWAGGDCLMQTSSSGNLLVTEIDVEPEAYGD